MDVSSNLSLWKRQIAFHSLISTQFRDHVKQGNEKWCLCKFEKNIGLDCYPSVIPVSAVPAPHSTLGTLKFSLQAEKSPGNLDLSPQRHWPQQRQAQAAQSCDSVLLPGTCICSAAAGTKHSPSSPPSLPPNTQATSTASSTHGLGAEAKKDPNSWCGMKCYIANAHLCIKQQPHTAVSGASPGEEPYPQAGGDVLCKCFWHLHSSVQPQRPHVPSRLTLGHGSRSKALACHQPPLPMLAQEEPTL